MVSREIWQNVLRAQETPSDCGLTVSPVPTVSGLSLGSECA